MKLIVDIVSWSVLAMTGIAFVYVIYCECKRSVT